MGCHLIRAVRVYNVAYGTLRNRFHDRRIRKPVDKLCSQLMNFEKHSEMRLMGFPLTPQVLKMFVKVMWIKLVELSTVLSQHAKFSLD